MTHSPAEFSLAQQAARLFPQGLRGLIFDCDGVIVDSRDANIGYYNMIMRELGRPPLTKAQEDFAQMSTSAQAIEQVLSPEELAQVPEICRRNPYGAVTLPLLKAEPGLEELLADLHAKGVRLGIHTNRTQRGMQDLLVNLGFTHMFEPVMTADIVEPKPHSEGTLRILEMWGLAPNVVAFVGDSLTDEYAACGAGVPLFAYASPGLNAALHVNSFHDLREALDGLCASNQS